jgi:hypothetical protein
MSGQCLFRLGVVAYFQLNRDYISEVFCINKEKPMTMCYGQCFLDKNLKLVDKTEKSTAPAASKEKIEISVFEVMPTLSLSNVQLNDSTTFASCPVLPVKNIATGVFHPPTFIS